MTPRKPSKKQLREHLRGEIRKSYTRYLDQNPHAARQVALAMVGVVCSRMTLEELQEWSLAITIRTECPSLWTALHETNGKPDDTP